MSWITKEYDETCSLTVFPARSSFVIHRVPIVRNICLGIACQPRNYRAYSRDETRSGSNTFQCRIEAKQLSTSRRHYFIIHSRDADRESQGKYIYINRKGYKVTRCRELKPPVAAILPLKRITDERNEVGWRTNGGLRRKKEKREKEG